MSRSTSSTRRSRSCGIKGCSSNRDPYVRSAEELPGHSRDGGRRVRSPAPRAHRILPRGGGTARRAAAVQRRLRSVRAHEARAAAARRSAGGDRRRHSLHQLHARQPVRHGDDSARTAAEVLRQGQGLGRAAPGRPGEDLRGAWHRGGVPRHRHRFVEPHPEKLHGATDPAMNITEFEQRVIDQKPVESGHYDSEYFTGDWRAEGNNYNLETRRQIEAKNPSLIKDVFQPKKVLDLGCGPGALMHLLWELGVDVEGIDFAESSKQLATPQVRDRITVGVVGDPTLKPANAYDLVICREVFEHLTVLQVKQTVANMVRMSSKFMYVTTRFHPNPDGLLDFTTQFDVDPSHITLLNKDMLRLMFVLEGCRSRPDLEQRMDWGNKGRVLVLEKLPAFAEASPRQG